MPLAGCEVREKSLFLKDAAVAGVPLYAVWRDPVERAASCYQNKIASGKNYFGLGKLTPPEYVRMLRSLFDECNGVLGYLDPHVRPQSWWWERVNDAKFIPLRDIGNLPGVDGVCNYSGGGAMVDEIFTQALQGELREIYGMDYAALQKVIVSC